VYVNSLQYPFGSLGQKIRLGRVAPRAINLVPCPGTGCIQAIQNALDDIRFLNAGDHQYRATPLFASPELESAWRLVTAGTVGAEGVGVSVLRVEIIE